MTAAQLMTGLLPSTHLWREDYNRTEGCPEAEHTVLRISIVEKAEGERLSIKNLKSGGNSLTCRRLSDIGELGLVPLSRSRKAQS
jgi:hypothetical protein